MNDSLRLDPQLMTVIMMIAMTSNMDSMLRATIGPNLEKRLGRPLTEWDWEVYWQEKANKEQCIAWNNLMSQWQRWFNDRETIRCFVWEEG